MESNVLAHTLRSCKSAGGGAASLAQGSRTARSTEGQGASPYLGGSPQTFLPYSDQQQYLSPLRSASSCQTPEGARVSAHQIAHSRTGPVPKKGTITHCLGCNSILSFPRQLRTKQQEHPKGNKQGQPHGDSLGASNESKPLEGFVTMGGRSADEQVPLPHGN